MVDVNTIAAAVVCAHDDMFGVILGRPEKNPKIIISSAACSK